MATPRASRRHIALARAFALAPGARDDDFHCLVGCLLPLVHAQSHRRFRSAREDAGRFMRRLGVRHEFACVMIRQAADDRDEAQRFFTES